MDTNICLIFLILSISVSTKAATPPVSNSTTPPVSNFTSPFSPTTIEPPKTCECLDTDDLQMDIDNILGVVNSIFQLNTNDSELIGISSTLDDIKEAVQDKTCDCTEGSILIQLEERTNALIDKALLIANKSANCACNNSNVLSNTNKVILGKLDNLGSLTNIINERLIACENDTLEIEAKLKIISSKSDCCNNNSLKEELKKMKETIDDIKRKVCDIQEAGCVCEQELKSIHDAFVEKMEVVLQKLDNISKAIELNNKNLLKFLERIEEKIDKIVNKSSTGNEKCDCLTLSEFLKNLPKFDPEKQKHTEKKEVKPWEITEECKEKLLCDYASCIEDAIHDLDDYFKPGSWNKMPEDVKKIMIMLYCKVGLRSIKQSKAFKSHLEAGNWKAAADVLRRTHWARLNPELAKDIVDVLLKLN